MNKKEIKAKLEELQKQIDDLKKLAKDSELRKTYPPVNISENNDRIKDAQEFKKKYDIYSARDEDWHEKAIEELFEDMEEKGFFLCEISGEILDKTMRKKYKELYEKEKARLDFLLRYFAIEDLGDETPRVVVWAESLEDDFADIAKSDKEYMRSVIDRKMNNI